MGQVHVSLISTSAVSELVENIQSDGFITEFKPCEVHGFRILKCKKRHCNIVMQTYPDPKDYQQTFAILPYPPYSYFPWRWPTEHRLFDHLTTHLDDLEIEYC